MPDTTAADMIVPEVWADMVQAEFLGNVVLANLATVDTTLEGKPGDTVHFPKFNPLTEAVDLTEGTAMTTEVLGTSDSTASIKEVGKAVEITDTALLTAYGDPLGEIRRQLGVVVARKIDTDVKATAEAAGALTSTAAANLSWDVLADGIGVFGDEWDPSDIAGLIIHSKQHVDLLKDPNFISADKLGAGNTAIQRGQVGLLAGAPVIVSDRVTVVSGTPDTYKALAVKRGSLSVLYKRRPQVETDRDILKRSTVITTNVHYALKRTLDRGVLVLTTQ